MCVGGGVKPPPKKGGLGGGGEASQLRINAGGDLLEVG